MSRPVPPPVWETQVFPERKNTPHSAFFVVVFFLEETKCSKESRHFLHEFSYPEPEFSATGFDGRSSGSPWCLPSPQQLPQGILGHLNKGFPFAPRNGKSFLTSGSLSQPRHPCMPWWETSQSCPLQGNLGGSGNYPKAPRAIKIILTDSGERQRCVYSIYAYS